MWLVHEDDFTGDSMQYAQINLDGATVKSLMTSAVKVQECTTQVLAKIDKDRTLTIRSATMRASYMCINRVTAWLNRMREHGTCSSVWFDTLWVREGTTRGNGQRLRWTRAYQEEHDVCSSFSMASTCSKAEIGRKVRAV